MNNVRIGQYCITFIIRVDVKGKQQGEKRAITTWKIRAGVGDLTLALFKARVYDYNVYGWTDNLFSATSGFDSIQFFDTSEVLNHRVITPTISILFSLFSLPKKKKKNNSSST